MCIVLFFIMSNNIHSPIPSWPTTEPLKGHGEKKFFGNFLRAHVITSRAHVITLRAHVMLLREHVMLLREHVKLLREHVIVITCAREVIT